MKKKSASQIAPRPSWKNAIRLAITALALFASPRSHADAQQCNSIASTDWINPGTGDWFDVSNWLDVNGTHSLPLCISPTSINSGAAHISTPHQTANACSFVLGQSSGQSGNLFVDHGSLHTCNEMTVGHQGKGTVRITNIDSSVTNTFGATIGEVAGSSGSVSVDGGGKWTVDGGVGIYVGGTNTSAGGFGLVSVTNGGAVNAASVYVWKSGTLTGDSTVGTTNGTTIEGTVSPSGGTLSFGGDLNLRSSAATQCNVTPQDNHDQPQVSVSGQVSLDGRLSVTMAGDFSSAPNRYTLLHASSVDPDHRFFFSMSIKYPTGEGWNPKIAYDGNYVYLDRVYDVNP